jgi:aminotransferase
VNSATSWIEADRLTGIELSLLRKLMAKAPSDAINLALGELGFPFPQELALHATSLLRDANPRYTPNAGIFELRQRIARDYAADASNICVCNGAEEALYIALQAIVNPNDIVAIPDPDYPAYPTLARLAGAEVRRLPFEPGFSSIDWKVWAEQLKGVKVLLMSSPANPTGYTLNREDSAHLGRILRQTGTILILDEIYQKVYCQEPEAADYSQFPRLIRINGLSKSHLMSGWRIGWINAHSAFIESATKLKQYISTCPAWLSQMLALYALDCPQIPSQIQSNLLQNQAILSHHLKDHQLHLPSASPYAMLFCTSAVQQAEKWMNKGVLTVPGIAFGAGSDSWIRINYAVEQATLNQALERLL